MWHRVAEGALKVLTMSPPSCGVCCSAYLSHRSCHIEMKQRAVITSRSCISIGSFRSLD